MGDWKDFHKPAPQPKLGAYKVTLEGSEAPGLAVNVTVVGKGASPALAYRDAIKKLEEAASG